MLAEIMPSQYTRLTETVTGCPISLNFASLKRAHYYCIKKSLIRKQQRYISDIPFHSTLIPLRTQEPCARGVCWRYWPAAAFASPTAARRWNVLLAGIAMWWTPQSKRTICWPGSGLARQWKISRKRRLARLTCVGIIHGGAGWNNLRMS